MNEQVETALREALAKADAELQGLEREAETLKIRIEEIVHVKTALEFTISRQGGPRRIVTSPEQGEGSWVLLSRRAAILKLLGESLRSLSPKEITAGLVAHGRADDTRGVSATLSRLKIDGKVRSFGYGKWTAAADDTGQPSEPKSVEPPDEESA